MLRFTISMIDRLCAVAGAFFFSQIPLFMNYYTHQLIGHVAELQWQVSTMRHSASLVGKSLDQYVQKFRTHNDPDFSLQGNMMQQVLDRWNHFSEGLQSLQHATIWEKPFFFVKILDWNIAKSTFAAYEPGVPTSLEGGIYTLAGLLFGFSIFWTIRTLGRKLYLSTAHAVER